MQVLRIVANLATADVPAAKAFYGDGLGLEPTMDHGWIATWGSRQTMTVPVSVASEGGSGTPVPDLSIEVDDPGAMLARMRAHGIAIDDGPVDESWGVRRFHVTDPLGKRIHVLMHLSTT